MTCACTGIEVGSHANTVVLDAPAHMRGRRFGCHEIRETICVDRCISREVESLWERGVTTLGCCCGHNRVPPYIQVLPRDVATMLLLRYRPAGERDGLFLPRSL